MSYRVYLVDGDEVFRQVMTRCLELEGWQVSAFTSASGLLSKVADRPNLWILDADGGEGFVIMREVRRDSATVGVILTSGRERVIDRVLGLELGCDDFVVKPFYPRELVLRARRIFERAEKTCGSIGHLLKMQDYLLDVNRCAAILDDRPIELTAKEFALLHFLVTRRGKVLSRKQILSHVWGENYSGSERVVDDLIRRMRRKLRGLEVETLYGSGYRMSS